MFPNKTQLAIGPMPMVGVSKLFSVNGHLRLGATCKIDGVIQVFR